MTGQRTGLWSSRDFSVSVFPHSRCISASIISPNGQELHLSALVAPRARQTVSRMPRNAGTWLHNK